jgi:hypothetical protein
MPIFIPSNSPSSQSPGAGTIGEEWPTYQVDPVWAQPPLPHYVNGNHSERVRSSSQSYTNFSYTYILGNNILAYMNIAHKVKVMPVLK